MRQSRSFLIAKQTRCLGVLLSSLLFVLAGCSKERPAADTIIANAKVYTVDAKQPWAEAVAVQGERILFVGSGKEAMRRRASGTKVIEAGGGPPLPGVEERQAP